MAGLLSRMMTILKAKFSKALDHAEDPGETLDYSYEKQLELLQNVKRGVADVATAKQRLRLQTAQLEQNLVKLETQARQALGQGREDLARLALERKSGVQQLLRSLDGQLQGLETQQEQLVANERTLAAKIESFRTQNETIKTQYSAAEASGRDGRARPVRHARGSHLDRHAARPRARAALLADAGRRGAGEAEDRTQLRRAQEGDR